MKIIQTVSLTALLFSITLAHAHKQPKSNTPEKQAQTTKKTAIDMLKRLRNGALSTTAAATFFGAIKYCAPHLIPAKRTNHALSILPVTFLHGAQLRPGAWSPVEAAVGGALLMAFDLLPERAQFVFLGAALASIAAITFYEKKQAAAEKIKK